MRTFLYTLLASTLAIEFASSADYSFRSALTTIPPKYMADIPLDQRSRFVEALEGSPDHLDAERGWVHWFSDGHVVDASSMIWIKELPRTGKVPLVFVHMAKPFSGTGGDPTSDQTFVLEKNGESWTDVTQEVMPDTVDMTMHFRTREADTTIEVAPWKEFERRDGRGKAWTYGDRIMDLDWDGAKFVARDPESKQLTKN